MSKALKTTVSTTVVPTVKVWSYETAISRVMARAAIFANRPINVLKQNDKSGQSAMRLTHIFASASIPDAINAVISHCKGLGYSDKDIANQASLVLSDVRWLPKDGQPYFTVGNAS